MERMFKLPKTTESKNLVDHIEKWKRGEITRANRRAIMQAYYHYKRGQRIILPETVKYIEEHVKPITIANTKYNQFWRYRYRFLRSFKNGVSHSITWNDE